MNAKTRKFFVNDKHHQKVKHQVDGLVYGWSQMPVGNDKKGFIHVIRAPTALEDSYIFKIKIDYEKSIHIKYLNRSPSN